MSFGRFSSYQSQLWMDEVEAKEKWLTVVSADPLAVSNPLTVELITTRILGVWVRSSTYAMTLTIPLVFPDLPSGAHVAGVAGFDAPVNGHLLFSDLLDTPVDFPEGGTYILPGSEYVIGIDIPGV